MYSLDEMREQMEQRQEGDSYLKHAGVRVGERLGIWARPAADCLYVFGYGQYAGDQNINGEMVPVIILDDKREMVLHYKGVTCSREAWVKNAIDKFDGDIHTVDLEKYLDPNFEHPTREDGRLRKANDEPANGEPPVSRRMGPETVFDKLNRLSSNATECKAKINMALGAIGTQNKKLQEIQIEMSALRQQALAEVDKLSGVEPQGEACLDSSSMEPNKSSQDSTSPPGETTTD